MIEFVFVRRVVNLIAAEMMLRVAVAGVIFVPVLVLALPVSGADFSQAKHIYVAPTRFKRADNYESSREEQAVRAAAGHAPAVAATKLTPAQVTRLRLRAESLMKQAKLDQANLLLKRCFAAESGNVAVQKDLLKVNLARSRQYEKQKKLDKAIACAREAIYFAPDNAVAGALLARQLKRAGYDSGSADLRLSLAKKLYSAGKLPEALVEYGQSYKLRPSAAASAGLGNVYLSAGKLQPAQQQYELALKIDPSYAEAYRQLGLMKLANKDIIAASSYLGKALEFDSNDGVAGKALIDLWKQQILLAPNSVNAHMGLARAYQLSGDFDDARTQYDAVAQLEPDNPALTTARATLQRAVVRQQSLQAISAARTLETQGALEEAKNRIAAALADDPKDAELLLLQGELLEKMGKPADAADVYRAVLYSDPNNAEAAKRLKELSEGRANFAAHAPLPGCGMVNKDKVMTQCPSPAPSIASTLSKLDAASKSNMTGAADAPVPAEGDVVRLSNFMLDLRGYVAEQQKIAKAARKSAHTHKALADNAQEATQ